MNILITGGTGLIGSAFMRHFCDYEFTLLTRFPEEARTSLPASVKIIESLGALNNLDSFNAVINLAGEPIVGRRWGKKQKEILCQSRWQTTQRLADLFASSRNPPDVFLSGSAIGVYGNRGDELLDEDATLSELDFSSMLCIRWETMARQADPYTRVVLLRTGIVLAPQGGALKKMLLPFRLCLGGPFGNGRQYMSWIHYMDYIRSMNFLLSARHLTGAVNLVGPHAESNRVFAQSLARSLHRPAALSIPAPFLQLILGESSSLLLDSQRVVPRKLLESGFEFQFPELMPALVDLVNEKKVAE